MQANRLKKELPVYLQHDKNACAATITRSIVEYFEPDIKLEWDTLDSALNRQAGDTIQGLEHLSYLIGRGYRLTEIGRGYDLERLRTEGFAYLEEFYAVKTDQPRWVPETFYEYFSTIGSVERSIQANTEVQELFATYPNYHGIERDPTTADVIDFIKDDQLVIYYGPGSAIGTSHAMLAWDYQEVNGERFISRFWPHPEDIYNNRVTIGMFEEDFLPSEGIVGVKFLGRQAIETS